MDKKQLLESLSAGEASFTYVKASGEKRSARGTLSPSLIPSGNNIEAVDNSGDMITYWDLDKSAFRQFNSNTATAA